METIPIKPERKAQLEEFAGRRGQDAVAALDDALAEYLAWERQECEEATAAIQRGYEEVRAGRTRPAAALSKSYARSMAFNVEISDEASQDARLF